MGEGKTPSGIKPLITFLALEGCFLFITVYLMIYVIVRLYNCYLQAEKKSQPHK